MIKRIPLIVVLLVILNIGTVLASASYDLNIVNSGIAQIESNKARISALDNSLKALKIDSRINMWNFIGRSGNEKNIQKRSRILREISSLKDENSGISAGLLKSREAMQSDLTSGLADPAFAAALGYLDGLAVSEALGTNFMDSSEAVPEVKSSDKAEFLRYKLEIQEKRLQTIQTLMEQLKAHRKAYDGAKAADMVLTIDKYLAELGEKLAEGKKSQNNINNLLK